MLSRWLSGQFSMFNWQPKAGHKKIPRSCEGFLFEMLTYFFFLAAFFLGAVFFFAAFFLVAMFFEFNG